jgi:hypothetical protein
MFTKAFIQTTGNEKQGHEERLLRAECERRGIQVVLYALKKIVSIDPYSGDQGVRLDLVALDSALAAYRGSGEAPSAYGIDFGVLTSGETALVEANDGYALGAYQISGRDYTDLLFTRWAELLSRAIA